MNLAQAKVTLPLNVLFDEFIRYCETEPLRAGLNVPPRVEIVQMVKSAKLIALLDPINPKYDIFQYMLRNVYNKMVEGQPLCKFNPIFCVWRDSSVEVIKEIKAMR